MDACHFKFYKLRDWVPKDKVKLEHVIENPNAIKYILEHLDELTIGLLKILYSNPSFDYILDEFINKFHLLRKKGIIYSSKNLEELDKEELIKLIKMNTYTILDDDIFWMYICKYTTNIALLKKYKNKINKNNLSLNPNAIEFLKENKKIIYLNNLVMNPNAIELLKNNYNFKRLNWHNLSKNPNAIELLKEYPTRIDWESLLSSNENPISIKMFENYNYKENVLERYWHLLLQNKNAIHLIKQLYVCNGKFNTHQYRYLCSNENAIELIKENIELINWESLNDIWSHWDTSEKMLLKNPAIFTYDYDLIKETNKSRNEEIIKKYYHPDRIKLWNWEINDE
jgi:hypothetical protein